MIRAGLHRTVPKRFTRCLRRHLQDWAPAVSAQLESPEPPTPVKESEGKKEAKKNPEHILDGISYYYDTNPPNQAQLASAQNFFKNGDPKLEYSTPTFRDVKRFEGTEVAFFGRSNVGKSSLLNAVFGKNMCRTSSKPGRTQTMNFYLVSKRKEGKRSLGGKVGMVDMPGYGRGSHEEWGTEIVKYITKRQQLRRAFLLIDPSHGIKETDERLLTLLRQHAVPHQIILSKIDRMLFPTSAPPRPSSALPGSKNIPNAVTAGKDTVRDVVEQIRRQVRGPELGDGPPALGEIITCSAEVANNVVSGKGKLQGDMLGINSVRWAILAAAGITSP